jgi:1-phosphofructokinase family hexose kinase
VNRASDVETFGGGKSAHVAMAAQALGIHPTWLGFLGGSSGEECAFKLRQLKLEVVPIRSHSPTRLNLELLHDQGKITEILERGGPPGRTAIEEMTHKLETGIRGQWAGALVTFSGSLPAETPPDFYASLIRIAQTAGAATFLDTSGEALAKSLAARPSLVKVNRQEAHEVLQAPLDTTAQAADGARQMIERGAQACSITLGGEGLIYIETKDGPAWFARPPRVNAVSTVGCGDATLAGFAVASIRGVEGAEAARFAASCGAANCLAPIPGSIEQKDVEAILKEVEVTKIS